MKASTKRNKIPPRAATGSLIHEMAGMRADLIRGAMLLVLSVLIWCTIYSRWSPESWGIPISYPHEWAGESNFDKEMELSKGDVLFQFAIIKAARDGHLLPVLPTTIPELGAPFKANWDDYPIPEKPLHWMMGFVAIFAGIFAAANFAAMLEAVLAVLAFYTACRMLKYSWVWSFAGALVFGFARFGFAHGIHHLPTAYIWHIPLCFLVFSWIIDEEGIHFRTRRFGFALVVAVITGVQNAYNTNMFAQLVLAGGLLQWWRLRDWRIGLPSVAIIATSAAGFLFMNANTFIYHLMHGGNPGAIVRNYRWMEIYGLKLVDMVMPPPDHRFGLFAAWGLDHISPTQIALSPGEMPPTAYLGLIGLAALAYLAAVSIRRAAQGGKLPVEAWLVLWIYLYSDVGGLNGVAGTLGFQLFRATTRYSIWILCVVIIYAARRLSAIDFKNWTKRVFGVTPWNDWFPYGMAFLVVFIALLDQTPPVTSPEELQQIASAIDSDRDFARAMEQHLPPNAMIFELPIMEFPESPTTIGSYDHFRPYLFSDHLRYAFGSDKGRNREKWQQEIAKSASMNDFISKLESYGFAGLYVNRKAFPDGGESFIKGLKSMGLNDVIESEKGDLVCIILKPAAYPAIPNAYDGLLN